MFQASELSIFGKLSKRAERNQELEGTAADPARQESEAHTTFVADREAMESRNPGAGAESEAAPNQHALEPASPAAETAIEEMTTNPHETLPRSGNVEIHAAAVPPVPATAGFRPEGNETIAKDRRTRRRVQISAPVRVRSINSTRNALNDVTTTENASRIGILLNSSDPAYYRGMDVKVTFPYTKASEAVQAEQPGRVVRVAELADGRRSIAIALGLTNRADEFILSNGETIRAVPDTPQVTVERQPNSSRPLVLVLDREAATRESLKGYLKTEGYDVITVASGREAREVLAECTPALLIAEIEGEGMPGYDVCVHCKSTPRLQRVPVVLMTSSAYPSDYASAHSLGAVVCIAKPYRQERLGNVVKLLAPPKIKEACEPPRPADPTRRHLGCAKPTQASPPNPKRRFLFLKK